MIRPVTWRRSTLAAIALCATLLAGCSTDQPYEPPTGPTTSELPSDSGPSESPSPTPDGPQPAEHSQYWTDSQLAAVEVVERHKAAYASISRGETLHGDQLDLDPLWQVATDPEWEETSLYLRNWL
ncbi:MAG: hypothetical protein LBJ44_08270, partial [Propionibacteriaceae bacterium]|nr:hypothetical protein [Propionibacteriaceae bacterium]